MYAEMMFLGAFFLSGAAVLSAAGLRGWGILPLGYLAGLFLWVLIGTGFAVVGAPTSPGILLTALVVLAVCVSVLTRLHKVLTSRDYTLIVGGMLVLAIGVWSIWAVGNVKYHIDSFRYLLVSGLLAENHFDWLNANLLTKRMLGAPLLHLPAAAYGASHVVALTPLMALSVLGALGWFIWQGRGRAPGLLVVAIGSAVVLLLATNNRFIWNAFYVNAHLFVGVALLILVATLWLYVQAANQGDRRFLLVLAFLSIPSLIVSRPEGFILAGLAVLPFLLNKGIGKVERSILAAVYLGGTLVWFGYVGVAISAMSSTVPSSVLGAIALAVAGLILLPLLWVERLMNWRMFMFRAVEGGMWILLGWLSIVNWELMKDSLMATNENLFLGAGSWGASVAMLLFLVVVTLLLLRRSVPVEIRFPLTAAVPVFFLLAHLREGAYRVGNGDSLNRMLIEIVPLAVLLLGVALVLHWGVVQSRICAAGTKSASSGNNEVT